MHLEVLDTKRREILNTLHHFKTFYLADGTALALQIGHRVSVDFDLFCEKPIPRSLLHTVEESFPGSEIRSLVNNADELTVLINDVKTSFVRYPFPLLRDCTLYKQLPLMSILEIGATKAYTIGRRGVFRDYVDLYAIIAGGYGSLNTIMSLAQEKFGTGFTDRLFLEQLLYLEDLEDTHLIFTEKPVTKEEIIAFFKKEVRQIAL